MTTNATLASLVAEKIKLAQTGQVYNEILFDNSEDPIKQNEFLFFVKPEITMPSKDIRLEPIVQLIFEKLQEFCFTIHRIRLLSADYILKYDLIDQHYQVIADVSKHGLEALNTKARIRFEEIFGVKPEDVLVLGGVQFEEKYPFFNDYSLDCIWQNTKNLKLASGAYAEKLHIDEQTVYLLNGFHPRQLRHFTGQGRSLIVFRISGDISWKEARDSFSGATIPENAKDGSIRHTLLERKEEFGLPEVAQSYNGIHLSAGPVEALVELKRFDSDFSDPTSHTEYTDFTFGRKLVESFGHIPQDVLQNAKVEIDGRKISIFDLTEDMDSQEALDLLHKYFDKIP